MRPVVLVLLLAPAIVQAEEAAIDATQSEDNELAPRTKQVEAAEPIPPPVPVLMPELTARKHLDIALVASTAAVVNMFELQIAGGYSFDRLEVFGDARARTWRDIDTFENEGSAALGNIKLGARYHVPLGDFVVAPSATVWLPTAVGGLGHWDMLARMGGVADARAYVGEGGLGLATAAAWYHRSSFIQLESGMAFVVDHGPQVASVFAAFGAGRQLLPKLAVMIEWRFEMFPVYETIQGPGFGIVRGNGSTRLRIRFHPYAAGDVIGGLGGFDIMTRFP